MALGSHALLLFLGSGVRKGTEKTVLSHSAPGPLDLVQRELILKAGATLTIISVVSFKETRLLLELAIPRNFYAKA